MEQTGRFGADPTGTSVVAGGVWDFDNRGTIVCSSDLNDTTVYLKNGNQIEGIITRETDDSVYIEMPAGNMSLSKSAIESIQRSTAEQADKIQDKWERERKQKERQAATRAQFDERQRAKGLVEYKGTWITPEKRDEIQRMEEKAQEGEAREGEIATLQKELENLTSENENLKQEIARLRTQLDQHAQEQLKLSREMLQQQRESLEFQKESEKRALGQRPPHIWVAPRIDQLTPYPTPSQ